MKALLKEPLLHFLLLGAALFLIYSLRSKGQTNNEITIPASKIAQITYSFEKTRQRKPTKAELDALIENYFKEQVAYLKGVEMGLLDGDGIIQKRVQQKLEFIVEDAVTNLDPSDEQLTVFLQNHNDDYRSDRVFSFTQLYFDPSKHQDVKQSMQLALAKLSSQTSPRSDADLLALSDNIYLELSYLNLPYHQVARFFGSKFADALVTMTTDSWQQNVKSGYGVHIVQLHAKTGGEIQSLAQVKVQVKQDWLNQQRQNTIKDFYQALFKEYQVNQKY